MIKRIIGVLSILSLLLVLIPTSTLSAVEAKYDPNTDPLVGTASEDIEKAIQAGKNILGTKYNLGGGHSGSYETLNSYKVANGLDCSSFIAYILMKGAGVGWPTIPTTYTMQGETSSALKKTVKREDWKRGDIILMNNTSHVVMYLGDGYYMGADSTPGVAIRKWDNSWMNYDGYVVRIPDTKTALANGMIALKADGSIQAGGTTGGSGEETTTEEKVKEFVDDELWKNPMVNFETREYVTNAKGISTTDNDGFSSNLVVGFKGFGNKMVEGSYIVLMAGSAFYFMYQMLVMTIYLAVLPRGSMKINDVFEKVTNLSPVRSNETLLDMLSKMLFSVVIIACLYVNVPTYLYAGLYSMLGVLF